MSVRVAFLQATLGVGGAERLVQSLATRMDRARVEPVIVNLFEPGRVGEELLAAGVRVLDRLGRSRSDLALPGRLRAAFVRERIDVVYVVDSPLPMFWTGVLRRLHARPRLVLAFHSTGRIADPVQHFVANRVTVGAADRIVALAESHRRYLVAQQHADPGRTDVIVSGVDLEAFAPPPDRRAVRTALQLPADAPLAGIVAALRPEKNHALFVEVAARVHRTLPEARFLVIGDGDGRAALESQVRAAGLEGVVMLLGVRSDVPQLWRALDVAVLTSHPLVETLPVTLLESHACAVPAVSTDVGSVRDAIEDGVTGFVVPPGDADAFATKLGALLADAGARAAMGVAARARAERLFDRDQMVRAYEDLFVRVAGGADGGSR